MKKYLFTIFMLLFSVLYAESTINKNPIIHLPKYKIYDLGTLGTDKSEALKINENGQIFGKLEDNGSEFFFIWSSNKELQIIDLPKEIRGDPFFNNSGQVAGNYYNNNYKCDRAFIWDNKHSYYDIGSLGGNETRVYGFNDNWQIIGISKISETEDHIFLWDNGKITDLTKQFNNQFLGEWECLYPTTINNKGEIVIWARQMQKNNNFSSTYVSQSFLYKNRKFEKLISIENSEVYCIDYDDKGNILASITTNGRSNIYFIGTDKKLILLFDYHGHKIINGKPQAKDELIGILKKGKHEELYYGAGIRIKKLLEEIKPFYDVGSNQTIINDQNSKGFVVGKINTIYSSCHAFLAVPTNN